MNPEVAKAAMLFLQRVQLTGGEVPAFNAVAQALQDVVDPKTATWDALAECIKSGQVSADVLNRIMSEDTAFARWYAGRI